MLADVYSHTSMVSDLNSSTTPKPSRAAFASNGSKKRYAAQVPRTLPNMASSTTNEVPNAHIILSHPLALKACSKSHAPTLIPPSLGLPSTLHGASQAIGRARRVSSRTFSASSAINAKANATPQLAFTRLMAALMLVAMCALAIAPIQATAIRPHTRAYIVHYPHGHLHNRQLYESDRILFADTNAARRSALPAATARALARTYSQTGAALAGVSSMPSEKQHNYQSSFRGKPHHSIAHNRRQQPPLLSPSPQSSSGGEKSDAAANSTDELSRRAPTTFQHPVLRSLTEDLGERFAFTVGKL
ncbi:hypothetical protein K437DRAFT_268806 [Tilletiaria anomala UBC 951]|uniref:Uncharacterized protein n=1 Tax=Tilletiaria anomala (strain ATCC 24038 / CBS 436.72 / UBC 951) TaxID=1037660 RepID=A0A066VSG5_TILAU|nr:uncharacterized protein K437DRAFT_268806 [Tilletiaria anomala UBC 951]KDN44381.1 hypothetical protein K437DRAFT_268806 [Tilletiaria anomala UBC 951]